MSVPPRLTSRILCFGIHKISLAAPMESASSSSSEHSHNTTKTNILIKTKFIVITGDIKTLILHKYLSAYIDIKIFKLTKLLFELTLILNCVLAGADGRVVYYPTSSLLTCFNTFKINITSNNQSSMLYSELVTITLIHRWSRIEVWVVLYAIKSHKVQPHTSFLDTHIPHNYHETYQ